MKIAYLFLALSTSLIASVSSFADTQIVSNFTGNRMCVAINNASRIPGAAIVEYECTDRLNQLFRLLPKDGDYVQIQSARSGLCLDLPAGTMANGEVYQQWGCGAGNSAPNQEFALQHTTGGFILQNRYSGKCLAVAPSAPFANGVPLIQEPCTYLPEELFHLAEANVVAPPMPAPNPGVVGEWICQARNGRGMVFEGIGFDAEGAREVAEQNCYHAPSRDCRIIPGSCHIR